MADNDWTISRIQELIPEGRENAVNLAYLANILHISERTVKKYISEIRICGTPIIGDQHGYYKPADRSELEWYYHIFRKRGLTALRSISSARRKLQELPGQMSISEVGNEDEGEEQKENIFPDIQK